LVQVALFINIKWFIRIALAIFWVVAAYLASTGQGFIMWMLENHTSTSLAIFFLSYYYLAGPFYAPFFQVKKKIQGGEVLMEKATKIMLVIIAILASLITVLIVSPGAREVIVNGANNTILQPAMGLWLGFINWLDGFRASYLLGIGIVGGLILAVFINQIALPKIRHKVPSISPKLPFTPQREPAEPEFAPTTSSAPTTPQVEPPTEIETVET
jgi:hypothetical protein